MAPGPPAPTRKSGRTMQVMVNLEADQYVDVRLNADSPWIVGIVLAVLTAAERAFGVHYEIRYNSGGRVFTAIFPANSPHIRVRQ
ncbi:hypothetical protein C8R44DRAFT_866876 [Mycena epipterygia]|nr:hypothetical protein C8R44DRAFT_866876 [Mycena epipterygia]